MGVGGRPAIPVVVQREFWAAVRSGMVVAGAAASMGVSITVAWQWVREVGGVMPPEHRAGRDAGAGHRLSLDEREEIACRRAAGEGVRQVARALGRPPFDDQPRAAARHGAPQDRLPGQRRPARSRARGEADCRHRGGSPLVQAWSQRIILTLTPFQNAMYPLIWAAAGLGCG